MMAVRSKLVGERMALLMFDMQLRYGEVLRVRQMQISEATTCIRCGQRIQPGVAWTAMWTGRRVMGHHAHDGACPPLQSDWLTDVDFYQVFDYAVIGYQKCADCRDRRATCRVVVPSDGRSPRGGIVLRYVCDTCVSSLPRGRM